MAADPGAGPIPAAERTENTGMTASATRADVLAGASKRPCRATIGHNCASACISAFDLNHASRHGGDAPDIVEQTRTTDHEPCHGNMVPTRSAALAPKALPGGVFGVDGGRYGVSSGEKRVPVDRPAWANCRGYPANEAVDRPVPDGVAAGQGGGFNGGFWSTPDKPTS